MSNTFLAGWLLGVPLLATAAYAQSVRDRTSEEVGPAARRVEKPAASPDLPRVARLIVETTNSFRRQEGRGALRVNPQLSKAAQDFADYLARTGKFSHTADGK